MQADPYTFELLLETFGGTAALTLSAALSVVALGTLMALPRPRH